MHEYLYNTDTNESRGFDPREEKKESGKGICWDLPEPTGTCAWNNFYKAAGPPSSYGFFSHNCHDAVQDAMDSCRPCQNSPPPIPPIPPWFNDKR
jgi:hypothetical protein